MTSAVPGLSRQGSVESTGSTSSTISVPGLSRQGSVESMGSTGTLDDSMDQVFIVLKKL